MSSCKEDIYNKTNYSDITKKRIFKYIFLCCLISIFLRFIITNENMYIPPEYRARPHVHRNNQCCIPQAIHTNSTDNLHQGFPNVSKVSTIRSLQKMRTKRPRFMSLSLIPGRTGNQMFQVASLLGIAHHHGYVAVIDPTIPLSNIFQLPLMNNINVTNSKVFYERVCCEFKQSVNNLSHETNWTLRGYLQSWRYFNDHEGIIKKAFTFKESYTSAVQKYLSNISKANVSNVGIHVRRGDFNQLTNLGYDSAPVSFIQHAMDYYENNVGKSQFIILSDDTSWCKQNINSSKIHFSPFTDPGMDMALMSSCDHMIITSGTFGWWGGWLAGGGVVYYRGFPRKGSWLETQFNIPDYYPDKWIGML